MKNLPQKIKAYTLKNAIAYNGKANQGAILSALFNEGLQKSEIKKIIPEIQKAIKEISKLSLEQQKSEFEKSKQKVSQRKVREGLPKLPNTKKPIIMRFAPSPSGAFHIGHALTASISFLYVKKYKGKFYVRIEDTNPENIYKPAYKLIKEDSKWLFKNKAKIIIQSERMNLYYKYAEKLIKKNSAYVCSCSQEKFREFVKQKKNCPCRNQTSKQNLEKWKQMLNGKLNKVVLRFKSSMKNKNPAMRDFPLARVNKTPHPLQKRKYNVWPLMNLSVTTDDIELKMTHIIRAKEHRDNAKRQKMIYKVLGKKYPWEAYLGRWKFTDMELSSTKITQGIKDKKYSGWNDKKLPTIQALKKKYKPEAFWKLAEERGLSEVDKVIDKKDFFELLDKFNRQ